LFGILTFEGRLWIHAASKVPDEATIKAMEDFYREIYAVNGITDLKFPEHYPVSRLLGIHNLHVSMFLWSFLFIFIFISSHHPQKFQVAN
jgi:hypothetical protein